MKKPDLKAFAKRAIDQSCDAYYYDVFFGSGGMCPEFYGELSCKKKHPKLIDYEDGHIQGRFNFLKDADYGGSIGDLYLLCSHYAEIGEEYYVFWWGNSKEQRWVVWIPNSEHYNDLKKEENA
jgi:hypothetical protein